MLTLMRPLDMHLHVREGEMLRTVLPLSAAEFAGAVVMPNLVPPVDHLERLLAYRNEIETALDGLAFAPLMTLFFREYSAAELIAAKPHLFAIKLYPAGVTTNSSGGVSQLERIDATLEIMEQLGIPLLVHGETHDFVMDREAAFMPIYARIAQRFPKLTIVMEHITTAAAVAMLDAYPNLHATITLHHLLITLDDVAGGMLQPHLFCKPIAKRPEDRDALLKVALSGHPKVMFGSDSAPHPRHAKEAAGCAAGVFTAPVILPMLVDLFERHDALPQLQAFLSDNAIRIHGLQVPPKGVTLARQTWRVPEIYGTVVPFMAGKELAWQVIEVAD